MHSSPVSLVTQLNEAMVQTWYWTSWAGNTGTRKGTAACQWNWKNNYLNFVLRGFVPVLGEAKKLWMSGFIPTVLPLWCSCVRNGNSWFMLHYGPVSGNEHAQGEDSSRYDRCGKRQRAAWFSTFHEAWKNNFSKRLTTRERKKWQCHQKVLALVCANMCVCVLVPSFSMGNIWSGEIWPVPPFRFPPVVPRVSKPGTVNKCLFSAQVHVADPNSMAGKPEACPSSQSKL